MRRPDGSGERRLTLRELSLTDPATVSLDQRSIVHLIERFIPTLSGQTASAKADFRLVREDEFQLVFGVGQQVLDTLS